MNLIYKMTLRIFLILLLSFCLNSVDAKIYSGVFDFESLLTLEKEWDDVCLVGNKVFAVNYSNNSGYDDRYRSTANVVYSSYDLNGGAKSTKKLDLKSVLDYNYDYIEVLDIALSEEGKLGVIAICNKQVNYKKQKFFFLSYDLISGNYASREIKDVFAPYIRLYYENDQFSFYTFGNNSRLDYHYGKTAETLSRKDVGFVNGDVSISNHNVPFYIIRQAHFWYDRPFCEEAKEAKGLIINHNEIKITENNSTTIINTPYLHNLSFNKASQQLPWGLVINYYSYGEVNSKIIFQNGWDINFSDDERAIRMKVKKLEGSEKWLLITSKGVYVMKYKLEAAYAQALEYMAAKYAQWAVKSELETEPEYETRIDKKSDDYKAETVNAYINRILPNVALELTDQGKYIQDFDAQRIKVKEMDGFYYVLACKNCLSNDVKIQSIELVYKHDELKIKALKLLDKDKTFSATNFSPPKLILEPRLQESLSEFTKRYTFEFSSLGVQNKVMLYEGENKTELNIKPLKGTKFEFSFPMEFYNRTKEVEIRLSSELGTSEEKLTLLCENYEEGASSDCFSSYYSEELDLGEYDNYKELINNMNIAIIVANSNFSSTDTNTVAQVKLKSEKYADSLKSILVDHYNYKLGNVHTLYDLSSKGMDSLLLDLKDIRRSDYYNYANNQGVSKVNLMLVVISHGSSDGRLICSDGHLTDMGQKLKTMVRDEDFKKQVKDFLYLEDICYGSLNELKADRGYFPKRNMASNINFCQLSNSGCNTGIMSAQDTSKVIAGKFISDLCWVLKKNSSGDLLSLEKVIFELIKYGRLTKVPSLINLNSDISGRRIQKPFYFYTHQFLATHEE